MTVVILVLFFLDSSIFLKCVPFYESVVYLKLCRSLPSLFVDNHTMYDFVSIAEDIIHNM